MGDNDKLNSCDYVCEPGVFSTQVQYALTYAAFLTARAASRNANKDSTAGRLYTYITEGRTNYKMDDNKTYLYGWCGDQVSKILFDMGVRSPNLNRVEMNGKWKPSDNIAGLLRLFIEHGAVRYGKDMFPLLPGDVYSCGPDPQDPGNDIHTGFIVRATDREVCTSDGNGFMSTSTTTKKPYSSTKLTINGRVLWWTANSSLLKSDITKRVFDVTARALAYKAPSQNAETTAAGGDGLGW